MFFLAKSLGHSVTHDQCDKILYYQEFQQKDNILLSWTSDLDEK